MRTFARRRRSESAAGFTVVELLVVIGIIAVLIAILLPALSKARDAAVRVKCAANLRTWGQAIFNYHADNRGQLPISYGEGGQPSIFWMLDISATWGTDVPDASNREASVEKFARYVRGFNYDPAVTRDKQVLGGAWMCPAYGDQRGAKAGWFPPGKNYATHTPYAYFARVSKWNYKLNPNAPYDLGGEYFYDYKTISGAKFDCTNPEDFVDTKLDQKKLLMSDMIMYRPTATNSDAWLYNHARVGIGQSIWRPDAKGAYWGSISRMGGVNQWGDGHVEWKDRDALKTNILMSDPYSRPHVLETFY